jgi:PKHD-type hydroxylase
MLVPVTRVLSAETSALFNAQLAAAPWGSGRITAGPQSSAEKYNMQLPQDSAEARKLGDIVLSSLDCSSLF